MIERWRNVDGAIVEVQSDGTGVSKRRNGKHGHGDAWVSVENMRVVRASTFWWRLT